MPKTYYNDGIVGNSSMLGCITEKGELVRLYWPHIDYPQHIEKFSAGIFLPEIITDTIWFDSGNWMIDQKYITDTNILETEYFNNQLNIKVKQTDFVSSDKDVLFRSYVFENTGNDEIELGFMSYTSSITSNPQLSSVLFDNDLDSVVHYRYNYYISVSSDMEVWKYQLGNNAYASATKTDLRGNDVIGMMNEAALAWKLGRIAPGSAKKLCLHICASHTLKEVKAMIKSVKKIDCDVEMEENIRYWNGLLKDSNPILTGNKVIDELYRRSILVFKIMSDKKTGGLLASPEIDEEFTKCGRYAYCWGRDAAFITGALDICGLHADVDKFYRWASDIQDEQGSWQQRYYMDGNLAPSWGLQIDETGTILWGILQHYKITGDKVFLKDMWECVERGAGFLIGFMDMDTGLPWLSFDLWEERLGEHAYSSAAVYGGLMAAAEIGKVLAVDSNLPRKCIMVAENLKAALEKNFWKNDWHRFIRSVRVKLNPWGEENTQDKVIMKVNDKGDYRDFTLEDWKVDISLLGLAVPFGVYDTGNPMMQGTMEVIELVLSCPVAGGLKRYENDGYAGGNPWLIASLWAALYHIDNNDLEKALMYFNWAVSSRTKLGLLPEQADSESGRPAWVIPLTWSHAMFVLTLERLIKKGVKLVLCQP
jgi:Glucoamylase and related glycosyl hydrolases